MIRANLPDSTERYDFLLVKVVEPFEHIDTKNMPFIKLSGIQKHHHFTALSDGTVLARDFSCQDCISDGAVCDDCRHNARVAYRPTEVLDEAADELHEGGGEPVDGEWEEEPEKDPAFENEADASFCLDSDADDEELAELAAEPEQPKFPPGSVVWAKQRSWFPGRVCNFNEIPDDLKIRLGRQPNDENVIVHRFEPFDDHIIVRVEKLDELGEFRVDRMRAGRGPNINQAYQHAVAELNDD